MEALQPAKQRQLQKVQELGHRPRVPGRVQDAVGVVRVVRLDAGQRAQAQDEEAVLGTVQGLPSRQQESSRSRMVQG